MVALRAVRVPVFVEKVRFDARINVGRERFARAQRAVRADLQQKFPSLRNYTAFDAHVDALILRTLVFRKTVDKILISVAVAAVGAHHVAPVADAAVQNLRVRIDLQRRTHVVQIGKVVTAALRLQRFVAAPEQGHVVQRDAVRTDKERGIVLPRDGSDLPVTDEIQGAAEQQRLSRAVHGVGKVFGVDEISIAVHVVFEFKNIFDVRVRLGVRILIEFDIVGRLHLPEHGLAFGKRQNFARSVRAEHDIRSQDYGFCSLRFFEQLLTRLHLHGAVRHVERDCRAHVFAERIVALPRGGHGHFSRADGDQRHAVVRHGQFRHSLVGNCKIQIGQSVHGLVHVISQYFEFINIGNGFITRTVIALARDRRAPRQPNAALIGKLHRRDGTHRFDLQFRGINIHRLIVAVSLRLQRKRSAHARSQRTDAAAIVLRKFYLRRICHIRDRPAVGYAADDDRRHRVKGDGRIQKYGRAVAALHGQL